MSSNKFFENVNRSYTFVRNADRQELPEFRERARAPNIEVLIDRIKLSELRDRVRFRDLMSDYDPRRTGFITVPRFHSCLTIGKVELSDREFRMLVDRYADRNLKQQLSETRLYSKLDTSDSVPVIRWMDFCDDVNQIFTTKQLERDPRRFTQPPAISTLKNLGMIDPVYSAKNPRLVEILGEYNNILLQRRIFVKPTFQDYDRHNNGRVSFNQFMQALKTLDFPIGGDRMNVLYQHYRDMKIPSDVNYLAFLRDIEVDQNEERKQHDREMAQKVSADMDQRKAEMRQEKRRRKIEELKSRPAAQMILELQRRYKPRQVRWQDWFVDHDRLNTGYVLASRFRQCMGGAGFLLTDIEFDFICRYFADDEDNHPGFINYRLFADVMDEPFTIKGYEKNPHMQFRDITVQRKQQLSDELTDEEEILVSQAMQRFHHYVTSRRVYIRPHLKDYDRLNNGHITKNQFRSSCGLLGLQFRSEEEEDAVCRKFCDSYGFMYYKFVDACETGNY